MARIVAKITFTCTVAHRDLNPGETYEEFREKNLARIRENMRHYSYALNGLRDAADDCRGGIELILEDTSEKA